MMNNSRADKAGILLAEAERLLRGEGGEVMLLGARNDIVSTLAGTEPDPPSSLKGAIPDDPPPERRVEINNTYFVALEALLRENTLTSHEKALDLINSHGTQAVFRWNDRHRGKRKDGEGETLEHLFSAPDAPPSRFAEEAIKLLRDPHELDYVVDLGAGLGRESRRFAEHLAQHATTLGNINQAGHVIAVDSSSYAIEKARERIADSGLAGFVTFSCRDYVTVLDQLGGLGVKLLYGLSSLHYFPPRYLIEVIVPKLARILTGYKLRTETEPGKLFIVLKTINSDSAHLPTQRRILDSPYNPTVDVDEGLFRLYFETKDVLISALEERGCLVVEDVETYRGPYDRADQEEEMVRIIASPSPEYQARLKRDWDEEKLRRRQ